MAWIILLSLAQAPNPAQEPPVLRASFQDGLHVTSADGDVDILIGGYVGFHYRVFPNRPADNVRTSPDTFFIRQARPELSGFIYRDFDFRLQLDFPTGTTTAATGTLQDAYAGWRYWPWLSVRVGQFKEPFGQEQTTPDRFLNFDERSDLDRLVPGRDLGGMVYGELWNGLFSYEVGAFNGQGRAVVDATDDKEVAGRLRTFPFALGDDDSLFRRLRLGIAGTAGTVTKSSINGLDFTSTGLNVLYLDSTAGVLDGPRKRVSAELTWAVGPFELRAEVAERVDSVDVGGLQNRHVRSRSGTISAAWLLTGEEKPIETRVLPDRPFDPRKGDWGAFELAIRADRLKIGREIFDDGIAPAATNSNAVTTYTAGVNWYLNRSVRISPNMMVERYDDKITFSDGRRENRFYGGILRIQVEF